MLVELLDLIDINTLSGYIFVYLSEIKNINQESNYIELNNNLVYFCENRELERVRKIKNEYDN